MGEPNSGGGVLPPIGEGEQPRNPVLGRPTHHYDNHLCGDHDRCEQFNHHGDSPTLHHHHNRSKDTDNSDLLIHDHDGDPNHGHYVTNHNSPSGYDYYANGHHNHRPDDIIFVAIVDGDDFDSPHGFLDNHNDDGAA